MQAVRAINARHHSVRGPGYSATDPELLLWVHATLVYSAIRGYRALVGPLTDAEADQYYQDTKEIGVLLGIPRAIYPERLEALEAYLDEMIDSREVAVGEDARRMADLVLRPSFRGVPRLAFTPFWISTLDAARARLSPSARLYSVEPRSSQWPSMVKLRLACSFRNAAAVLAPPQRPPVFMRSAMLDFVISRYSSVTGSLHIFSPDCSTAALNRLL